MWQLREVRPGPKSLRGVGDARSGLWEKMILVFPGVSQPRENAHFRLLDAVCQALLLSPLSGESPVTSTGGLHPPKPSSHSWQL